MHYIYQYVVRAMRKARISIFAGFQERKKMHYFFSECSSEKIFYLVKRHL